MVGDEDPVGACGDRAPGVVGVQHALHEQRPRPFAAQPLERLPRERRVHLRVHARCERDRPLHAPAADRQAAGAQEPARPARFREALGDRAGPEPWRDREAVAQVALAAAGDRDVGGERERGEPGLAHAREKLPHPAPVAPQVELEPRAGAGRGGGDLLRRARRRAGQQVDRSGAVTPRTTPTSPLGCANVARPVGAARNGTSTRCPRPWSRCRPPRRRAGRAGRARVGEAAAVARERDLVLRPAVDELEHRPGSARRAARCRSVMLCTRRRGVTARAASAATSCSSADGTSGWLVARMSSSTCVRYSAKRGMLFVSSWSRGRGRSTSTTSMTVAGRDDSTTTRSAR